MKVSRKLFGIVALGLLMLLSVSVDAMGQGRGRRISRNDKKCAKFVNCHDARDGRVDGRGPNRRVSWRDRVFRRHRRNRDDDRRIRIRRDRDRDRDFDRDRVWRHRR
ncbi:MAG TPA: hypothetical protein VFR78_13265 [Pyrinomonadaceae bacterium]|nr:hypothetical protein [Pyrinomonadaceae bacterium]